MIEEIWTNEQSNMIRSILAQNVAQLMKLHKSCSTQMQLSKKSGIGQSTIGRILRSDVDAGVETIERLAMAFRVEPYTLLVDPNKTPEEANKKLSSDEVMQALALHTADWSEEQYSELLGAIKAYRAMTVKE